MDMLTAMGPCTAMRCFEEHLAFAEDPRSIVHVARS